LEFKRKPLTAEQLKHQADLQAALYAEALGRGRLSPEARHLQLGLAHETAARAEMEMLAAELRGKVSGKGARKEKSARLDIAKARLAEALAHQGRFDEAAALVTGAQKLEYENLWQAVWREDNESCPCEPLPDGLTHDHVSHHAPSQSHGGKLMPVVKCNQCGFLNVRPLTHALQEQKRVREHAESLLHGRRPEDLRHQAKELLARLVKGGR
jgi:hypothetical protein